MNTPELHTHLRAVAEQYYADASAVRAGGKDDGLARYYEGKADAYWVAAAWLQENLMGDVR